MTILLTVQAVITEDILELQMQKDMQDFAQGFTKHVEVYETDLHLHPQLNRQQSLLTKQIQTAGMRLCRR